MRQHNLNLQTNDTLAEEDVAHGDVNELAGRITGVDHETIGELHGLGTLGTEFARYHDLTTLGAGLHNEAQNTIAGTRINE